MEVNPAWHEGYWGDGWLRVALHFTGVSSENEAGFIERALSLRPGMHVLDLPCGHGRHSIELAKRGMKVTGIDVNPESIRIAADAARHESLDASLRFQVGDMRTVAVDDQVDAVIMMQTSFGFMETEEEDRLILQNIRRSLVPGGRLLMDMVSVFRLARTMIVPRRWERLDDGTVHIEEREYDFRSGRRITRVELFTPDGEHFEMSSSIRIYTLPELSALLAGAGYQVMETFGGYDGQPISFESKRLIVVAQRLH
jgi:SAM-dependent methyltransferase